LFSEFYAETFPFDTKPKCIILANAKNKILWDIWITFTLLFITIAVPVRLAFYDRDPLSWILMYGVVDFSFLTDLVLTFFTSYTDETTNKEVTSHKKIARTYF
jgi:hypothetical protein